MRARVLKKLLSVALAWGIGGGLFSGTAFAASNDCGFSLYRLSRYTLLKLDRGLRGNIRPFVAASVLSLGTVVSLGLWESSKQTTDRDRLRLEQHETDQNLMLSNLRDFRLGPDQFSTMTFLPQFSYGDHPLVKSLEGQYVAHRLDPILSEEWWRYSVKDGYPFSDFEIVHRIVRKQVVGASLRFMNTSKEGLRSGVSFDFSRRGKFFRMRRVNPNRPELHDQNVSGEKVMNLLDLEDIIGLAPVDDRFEKRFPHTVKNPDVIVSVFDLGIDYNHPRLARSVWRNPGELKDRWGFAALTDDRDSDSNGYIDDSVGLNLVEGYGLPYDGSVPGILVDGNPGRSLPHHGTMVSGLVVEGTSKIKLMTHRTSLSDAHLVEALQYVKRYNEKASLNHWPLVRVVNLSFVTSWPLALRKFSEMIAETPEILFVAGAGNAQQGGSWQTFPAGYPLPHIVSVTALDASQKVVADWSAKDPLSIDLAARGELVEVLLPGGQIGRATGTSFSAPSVANIASKIWLINPRLTVGEVKQILILSADRLPSLVNSVRYGRVNAERAYARALLTL